ncbi:hypothetical protein WA171_000963 [Blastocystis sp. BT1]
MLVVVYDILEECSQKIQKLIISDSFTVSNDELTTFSIPVQSTSSVSILPTSSVPILLTTSIPDSLATSIPESPKIIPPTSTSSVLTPSIPILSTSPAPTETVDIFLSEEKDDNMVENTTPTGGSTRDGLKGLAARTDIRTARFKRKKHGPTLSKK